MVTVTPRVAASLADRVDLLAVAVDQRDPGPLVGGVAAFGLVEHGRDDRGDVVGEVGSQPFAGHDRTRPAGRLVLLRALVLR